MARTSKENPSKSVVRVFPVVGIGASAGGLDAYKRFLKAIPQHSGNAYILVQHLDPSHESMLPEILARVTALPVHEITDNINLVPDHIYILPSNKLLTATDGVLKLKPRLPKDKRNMPIDLFFTSLAEVHKTFSVGVLMSGTGADGTLGLRAIKENGGITFCQDFQSAAFDQMLHSAIDAGVVDVILPPEGILREILEHDFSEKGDIVQTEGRLQGRDDEVVRQMLSLLNQQHAVDFTYYKQNTIKRRISRRMAINLMHKPEEYLRLLKTNATELALLFNDLLISVTGFFRDAQAFETLKNIAFPAIAKEKTAGDAVRIWIAGCATGEEAYSLAISIFEFMNDHDLRVYVQIFATDISEKSIGVARAGIYAEEQLGALSDSRKQQFFMKLDGRYQVAKFIRDMCVFATHNFLKDPPFARMDLISCRNVLIYMNSFLQKKALAIFHYALREKGVLFLGKSETGAGHSELFSVLDKNEKIYSKKSASGRFAAIPSFQHGRSSRDSHRMPTTAESSFSDFQKNADYILLQDYTPAAVVINEQSDIVHFRGDTSPYLTPSSGKPNLNLFKMIRKGLGFELRNCMLKARSAGIPVEKEGIPIQFNGVQKIVNLKVVPLPKTIEPYYLVLFFDAGTPASSPDLKKAKSGKNPGKEDSRDVRILQLELELVQNREDMKAIAEDQEAVNEELQSANEELLSGNEEQQSLNEELETSKEEIQSSNEELTIVNQELLERTLQINDARMFSDAIIGTIRDSLLVLNNDLIVRNASQSFYRTFRETAETTEGKMLYDLGDRQWNIPQLRAMLQNIIPGEKSFSDFELTHVFPDIGERTMLLNARQIRRESDKEQLILLAIEDITGRKAAERNMDLLHKELENKVVERTRDWQTANTSLLEKNQEIEVGKYKLERVNQELRQSNDALLQFAHVASHDLKEPLRKMKIFATRLEDDLSSSLSEKGRSYLSKVHSASARMFAMVDGVLAYSTVDAHEHGFEAVDLEAVFQHILTDLEILIDQNKAVVQMDKLPQIEGAWPLIYQLFYNLVKNALKFTRNGTQPVISVRSRIIEVGPEHFAEIHIEDNGIGLDNRFAEEIFDPFIRLNSREQYEGTGLGLALCKRIAQRHGGSIVAAGEVNKGSMFTILLPLKQKSTYD